MTAVRAESELLSGCRAGVIPGSTAYGARGNLGTGVRGDPPPLRGRVHEGEDDLPGERSPGRVKACEPGVNRCQFVPIGAGVAMLRRCRRESRNP